MSVIQYIRLTRAHFWTLVLTVWITTCSDYLMTSGILLTGLEMSFNDNLSYYLNK